jgi:flagellin-like hook-associated protein FlgL
VDFDDVADDLYGLAPERFTASRDARAGEARAAGDRALAERIKKLRRPTVSAWLGNRLARDRADDIEGLLGLGAELREAQAELSGDELRRLSRRRGQAVAALVAQAKGLARAEGQSVSDAILEEVNATLEAALADRAAAEALRRGRLTGALRYSGLGFEGTPSAPTENTRPTRAAARGRRGQASATERRSAQQAAERATDDVARASATLGAAEDELRATRERLEKAEAAVTSLRVEEADAVQRVTSARKEHRSALATQHRLARAAERLE